MASEPLRTPGMVEFAQCRGQVAVIRLVGRCSFQNSAYLQKAAEVCERELGPCSFVLDLDRCESMDSTFLGVLAGIALRQRQVGQSNLIAVNVSPRLRRSMSLLGLTHVLDLRDRQPDGQAVQQVEVGESDRIAMSRAEQVAHMIQAHHRLIELDSGNEIRFDDVMKYLEESLSRAREIEQKQDNGAGHLHPSTNSQPNSKPR